MKHQEYFDGLHPGVAPADRRSAMTHPSASGTVYAFSYRTANGFRTYTLSEFTGSGDGATAFISEILATWNANRVCKGREVFVFCDELLIPTHSKVACINVALQEHIA